MPLTSARSMLAAAVEGGYCVGAFNCTSLVQLKAVVDAAADRSSPIIVQTSLTPARWFGPEAWAAATRALAERVEVPVCLHLDHCDDEAMCERAARAGYTNIMIDASHQPFDQNVAATRRVVEMCHALGDITVEGELGTVGGVEDQVVVAEDEAQLADPAQSIEFVRRTGVDLFAPAIGTAHGVYKTAEPKIDVDRFALIHRKLNTPELVAPLIIHGGTGLQTDVVKRLIAAGGAKYNVSTDLKHALIDTSANYLAEHRSDHNPGALDKAVYTAMRKRLDHWIEMLGSADRAAESLPAAA
jgi:tagatose 1,6-diphosphate aldolase GatY/KbaY